MVCFVSSTPRFKVLLMIYMVDSQTHFDQSPRVDLRPIKKGDWRVRFIATWVKPPRIGRVGGFHRPSHTFSIGRSHLKTRNNKTSCFWCANGTALVNSTKKGGSWPAIETIKQQPADEQKPRLQACTAPSLTHWKSRIYQQTHKRTYLSRRTIGHAPGSP